MLKLVTPRRSKTLLLSGASLAALLMTAPVHAATLAGLTGRSATQISATPNIPRSGSGMGMPQMPAPGQAQATRDFSAALSAIQAKLSAQAAQRSNAVNLPSNVPDGMTPGGLVVDPRVIAGTDPNLWVNAKAPVQATSGADANVTIQQTDQRAVMTWQSFNVGKNTTVHFDQSGGNSANGNDWVALNRIDATGVPSQIQGQIQAEGTVLLINPNGIVFGGSAQINVHSLIASSLDVNSYSGQSANVGVFNSTGSYAPVTVGGQAQTTADGTVILAPAGEDNGDAAFLANGLFINGVISGQGGTLILSAPTIPNQTNVGVTVQQGASISTDVSGFDNGGLVALVGSQVTNAGNIQTSAGQIVLASGNSVFLTAPNPGSTQTSFTATNQRLSPGLSLVYVPPAVLGGAHTVNDTTGILTANRGAITLAGDAVQQLGVAEATTSITRAGSITILASGLPTTANPDFGSVVFGPGSLTTILPEENGETIPSDAASLASFVAPQINIATTNLDLRPGSLILAPGATMNVTSAPIVGNGTTQPPLGRVLLEAGSTIDLAGLTNVAKSVKDTLFTFKVTANDVADTPLAQNLIGQSVTIDLSLTGTRADGESWVGSPLFASSGAGYLTNIAQPIDQLLTKGGALNIGGGNGAAFTDIVTAPGSLVNVSGGWIDYASATVTTTRLMGADGRLYDIGSADPFMAYATGYAGAFTLEHPRWAVSDTYTNALINSAYQKPGYLDGISAGAINLTGVNPVLEGDIAGDILIGFNQRQMAQAGTGANGAQATPDQLPNGASLAINIRSSDPSTTNPANVVLAATAPDVLGPNFNLNAPLSLPVTDAGLSVITYSTDALSAMGLGAITIKGANDLTMEQGASLSVLSGGSITLSSASTIDGTLTAHAGNISITGYVPASSTARRDGDAPLAIGSNTLLDVSGLWVNDANATGDAFQGAAFINGGSVAISTGILSKDASLNSATNTVTATDATQSIILAPGSVIDLTSGGYVGVKGKLALGAGGLPKGKGGNVSLITYANSWQNTHVNSGGFLFGYNAYAPTTANTATVTIDGTIYAEGLSGGGTFMLQAPGIIIDGNATNISSITSGTEAGTVVLPSSFFASNGFSNYDLISTYGSVIVTAGTQLVLKQKNYLLSPGTVLPATGALVRNVANLGTAPDGMRPPVDLTLTQLAFEYGAASDPSTTSGIAIGQGASVITDPLANVTLNANGSITVLGSITAPGGDITLTSQNLSLAESGVYRAAQDIWIGANAVLDVSGVFVRDPTVAFYSTGSVLGGGAVTLSSNSAAGSGAVIALAGSRFNLEGTSATIQTPNPAGNLGGVSIVQQDVWSNGGTLTINGNSIYFGGDIAAAGGAPQASGGTLNFGSTVSAGLGNIVIAQSGDVASAFAGAVPPVTAAQFAALRSAISNADFITADTINAANSGLDSVALTGAITFSGDVVLDIPGALYLNSNITLAPKGITPSSPPSAYAATPVPGGIATIGATDVTLNAGYINWLSITAAKPALADGTLTLNASTQIDLGGIVSASNAGQVNLVGGGDIRFVSGPGLPYAPAGSSNLTSDGNGGIPSAGALLAADNLTLTAREIYPETDTAFLLMSLGLAPTSATGTHNTITFASNGKTPSAPLSAGGAILVDAKSIVQGDALYAPLGTIQLGYGQGQTLPQFLIGGVTSDPYDPVGNVNRAFLSGNGAAGITTVTTQNVTLSPGSLTSVSGNGLDIPYGTTTDGINWTDGGIILNGPPDKLIVLGGANIDTQAGAVVDASGGGDVYATEFVPGTGGSRNVLTATSQTVYALVPGAQAPAAPYDPSFGATVALGTSVTLPGGNGIPAGTYTLMPGMYATLPGAYRVTVVSTDVTPKAGSSVAPDGSIAMTGTLGNSITGAKSSQTALLQIQPNATWTKYSEIDIAQGNDYFARLAATNAAVTPRLASDAGHLVIAALNSLTLNADNDFAPAKNGRSGQVDITGTNLLVVASDLRQNFAGNSAYSGYLVLDADQISNLGVDSVMIGGTRTNTAAGTQINATALNLEVATDSAHALTSPELLLVSFAPTSANPAVHGLTVDTGSVITAKGSVAPGSDTTLIFGTDPVPLFNGAGTLTGYSAGVSGDGALLRVSNGAMASVTRNFVPGIYTSPATTPAAAGPTSITARASLSIGSGATISGNALTLDTSGTSTLAPDAILAAKNYDLSGSIINLGAVPDGAAGLTVSPQLIAAFAGADTVRLRSASVFNLYGDSGFGSADAPIGALTLDGSGFTSDGGTTSITATNIVLADSQATPNSNGANTGGAGSSLAVTAGDTITLGAGAKTLTGFAQAGFTAGKDILFTGSGSLDAGNANVALTAPTLVADAGSAQSLITTGALSLAAGPGTAPALDANNIGGALTLTAGSISDAASIMAQAGKVTLEATTGDLMLASGATIGAAGTRISLFDLTEDTPGGTVKLIADSGNVTIADGATVDVSAAGNGYAGTLGVQAADGTVALNGTLKGAAAYNDLGGSFTLVAGTLSGNLPLAGFTGSFEVSLGNGDIAIASGQTLTSQNVLLVANNGAIAVDGAIDASGPSGGNIALYGAGGVAIGGDTKLYARYQADDPNDPAYANGASTLVQRGGTVTLGTTGTPDGSLNAAYGYENIRTSGAITVASGAIFDVSGGPGGANIDNTGGAVTVRAPILANNTINVSFNGTLVTNADANGNPSGNGIVVDAYAVWSTTDNGGVAGPQHFDGIIDPAGWYGSTGTLVAGTFTNAAGTTVATWNGTTLTGGTNPLSYYLTNAYFTPTAANAGHQTFYGYAGGAEAGGAGTLMGFVQNPFRGNDAAVAASFAGAKVQLGNGAAATLPSAMLHLRPEIDLVNPGGDISVLTNWNLGAVKSDGTLAYRHSGEAPVLSIRAGGDVAVNASITDGFAENSTAAVGALTTVVLPTPVPARTLAVNANAAFVTAHASQVSDILNAGTITQLAGFNSSDLTVPATPAGLSSLFWKVYGTTQATPAGITTYLQIYNNYIAQIYALRNNFSSSGYTLASTTIANSSAAIYNNAQSALQYLAQANSAFAQINGSNAMLQNTSSYEQHIIAWNKYYASYTAWSNALVGRGDTIGQVLVAPATYTLSVAILSSATLTLGSNAQADNGPAPVTRSSNQSPISSMDLASEVSSSYRIVAGALPGSANPLAVNSAGAGDVTINGHAAYTNTVQIPGTSTFATIDVPTIVRTGTGSIDIAAAGDFELLDQTTPGAVYTAGTIAPNAAGFTAPVLPATASPNGALSTPSWAQGGGSVTINVGRDIVGIETPVDTDGSQTGAAGLSTGQFWSSWYYSAGKSTNSSTAPFNPLAGGVQNSSWINYATFFQGISALGGGDITLTADRNIYDISGSLPETIQVSGGTSTGNPAVAHYYGGGNLSVQAGGDLYSSTFYVGRGTGRIVSGGDVVADPHNPVTGKATAVPTTYYNSGKPTLTNPVGATSPVTAVPLLLAVQDGFISVQAPDDVTLGGIFAPSRIPVDTYKDAATMLPAAFGIGFDSYGANSGVALTSLAGNVTIDTLVPSTNGNGITDTLFTKGGGAGFGRGNAGVTPATLDVTAISGDIAIANSLYLIPSANGSITLAAGGDISTVVSAPDNPTVNVTNSVVMLDGTVSGSSAAGAALFNILGIPIPTVLASALHAHDPNPVIIYAGQDITGAFDVIKPVRIEAGRDIVNVNFIGQNNNPGDITSIIAGRDILADQTTGLTGLIFDNASQFKLYGPGDFLIEAGRNLGPFVSSPGMSGGGILAVGDGSNSGGNVVTYLPVAGANITALFGVGPGMDTAAAVAAYVDPATANTSGINYLPDIAKILGETTSDAWTTFQGMLPSKQKLLVGRAFLDFLTQVSLDYNNAASPYYHQFARAYQTIATLFPAALGYTNNNTGGSNGASTTVHTGDLRMAHSLIETQTGGDITLLGPGGSAFVGSNSADSLSPSQQGILTLQGGTISGYTDGSVQVFQSRIFTEQGGDVDLFSANGDLNAGKGPKSSAAYPPLKLICDVDGYCRVSPAGLVTGAGIGALLSVPGQDPAKSNAVLTAPHGTVDAGAAGIRVAGNLNIVALSVANAFNIEVGGQSFGLPPTPVTNLTLTTASTAATEAASIANNLKAQQPQTQVDVEITGFGGDLDNPEACVPNGIKGCAP